MAASNEQTKRILIGFIVIFCSSIAIDCDKIGVNYGLLADNLPSPQQAAILINNNNIGQVRIFEGSTDIIKILEDAGIDVVVGVENSQLQLISTNQDAANGWVRDVVKPFSNIKYIAVGNEVLPSTSDVPYLVNAISNIQTAIQNANLQDSVKVSTAHGMEVLGNSYPPSQAAFRDDVKENMSSILKLLSANGAPFLANVYTYYGYTGDPSHISLDYALFKSNSPVVTDGDLSYSNLFDAIVDSFFSAMEALGYSNIPLVVSESGWPSAGNADVATVDNAQTYNSNLIKHVLSNVGTPKRPGTNIETYIFALFNEDNKTGAETERHFGLFYPDQSPVYPVNFTVP
eukprot:PITA_12832